MENNKSINVKKIVIISVYILLLISVLYYLGSDRKQVEETAVNDNKKVE